MNSTDKLPTISGPHVVLRWLTEADIDDLFAIFSNADVTKYWSHPPMTARAEADKLLAGVNSGFERGDLLQWGLTRRDTNRVIGTCTLSSIHRTSRRAEIGFALGRPHWGNGLMSEALQLLLKHAFSTLDLNRLEADVDPRNAPSLRRLEKLGFQKEGYMPERWIVDGEVTDTVFYGLLARDWDRNARDAPTA